MTTAATRSNPRRRDERRSAPDAVPGERGAPGVDADPPVPEPHADADLRRAAQVGGEARVAGQRPAVARRRRRDETPRGKVAQQVGVAGGGLQPVVAEGDRRQPEPLLRRVDDARDARHPQIPAQHGERARPGQLVEALLRVAHRRRSRR